MADKTYLVVGGSHGIGLGIVGRLLQAGSEVTTISRTWEADQVGEQVFDEVTGNWQWRGTDSS